MTALFYTHKKHIHKWKSEHQCEEGLKGFPSMASMTSQNLDDCELYKLLLVFGTLSVVSDWPPSFS
jgi:hypothetical protein